MINNPTFPRADIDPKLKAQPEWLRLNAQALWSMAAMDYQKKIFYHNRWRYEEIKDYVLGVQNINKYKTQLGIAESDDKSWLNIDWSVRRIVPKIRAAALNKMKQINYNIICQPLDPLAKDEADQFYAEAKAKILLRDALRKAGSELSDSALLARNADDPEDLTELEMQMDFGGKTNRAMEAEIGISVVFNDNDVDDQRMNTFENIYDYGVSVYRDYIDDNGRVRTRVVDPRNFICNYCVKKDFSDMWIAGEVINVPMTELNKWFSDEICEQIVAKNKVGNNTSAIMGRATPFNRGYDPYQAKVLDLVIKTTDTIVFEDRKTKNGNTVFRRVGYDKLNSQDKVYTGSGEEPKFKGKKIENIYRVKWVVDTDFVYDYGLEKNMKRSTEAREMSKVYFPYQAYAPDFHEMKALSRMEQLIPLADEYQLTVYKIQNFKNKWMPSVIGIDLDALEDVALGGGLEKMKPQELIDMMFQMGILVYRRKDIQNNNVNYKPITIEENQTANELIVLVNDLQRIKADMEDIAGLNDLTSGATPNSKTLIPVAQAAIQSTNSILYGMIYGEKFQLERLANACLRRLQTVLVNGDYAGYYKAIGTGSVKFFQLEKGECLKEYAIKLEAQTTDDEKQMVFELMKEDIAQGNLDTSDVFMILETYNGKQAFMLLSYRVKKNKERRQMEALQMQQANAQTQIQSNQAAEQAKQATLQLEYQLKMQLENLKGEWQYKIAGLKGEVETTNNETSAQAKVTSQAIASGHNYVQTGQA